MVILTTSNKNKGKIEVENSTVAEGDSPYLVVSEKNRPKGVSEIE
jgi:hypothetical protein